MSAFKFAAEQGVEEGKKKKKKVGISRGAGAALGAVGGAGAGAIAGLAKEPLHMGMLQSGAMAPDERGYGSRTWLNDAMHAGAPIRSDVEALSAMGRASPVPAAASLHTDAADVGRRILGGAKDGLVGGYTNVPLARHLRNAGIGAGIGGGTGLLLGALLSGQREVDAE